MDLNEWLLSDQHEKITDLLKVSRNKKDATSFNIFSVSGYNNQRENFHSDVIASILKPKGSHGEGRLFLDLFFDYLGLSSQNYPMPEVIREMDRIDISIRDPKSKKAILIENKINNASDQEDQIAGYYDKLKGKGYTVELVVYLTLDGVKQAPTFENIKCPVVNLGAFKDSPDDLVNGWLKPCINAANSSQSFLNEYIKLIKSINAKAMEKNAYDAFYDLLNMKGALDHVEQVKVLSNEMPKYRMDKLVSKIKNFAPFKRSVRYQPHHHLFENYHDGNYAFKLDFGFTNQGKGYLIFWVPELNENPEMQESTLMNKINTLNLKVDLVLDSNKRLIKEYHYRKNQALELERIDNEIFGDIDHLLNTLRESLYV